MSHDWTKETDSAWRAFVAESLENVTISQKTLSEKFDSFCEKHQEEHKDIDHRLTTTETKSGIIATLITVIGSIVAWVVGRS